jgi:putative ABC transport system permease protein
MQLQPPVLGTRLTTPDGFLNAPDGSQYQYTVVGVVKDFHYQSLHQTVSPLVMLNTKKFQDQSGLVSLGIKAKNFEDAITAIEATWKKFVPETPFHYNFLDQALAAQYASEKTLQRVFTIFSTLAIFNACIGLLGLAAYTTQQRTREISIRKVLGASVGSIIGMLSKDFLKLVFIAALLAFPLAWWGMNKWLQDFAYRIELSWWVFAMAGITAALIALLTIGYQAIRAAITNPVNSLRNE